MGTKLALTRSGMSRNQRPFGRDRCVRSWTNVRKSESCHFMLTDSARDWRFPSGWDGGGGGGVRRKGRQIPHKIIPALVFKKEEVFNETRQTNLPLKDKENSSKKLGHEKEVVLKNGLSPSPKTRRSVPILNTPESLQTFGL